MARKPNYQFEKRQKELDRKARKQEKLQRRLERATDAEAAEPASDGPIPDGDASHGTQAMPASEPR
jgi:hypothetical protein